MKGKDIVELLIGNGADVNATAEVSLVYTVSFFKIPYLPAQKGFTPLHESLGSGAKDTAELLIAHGASIHSKTKVSTVGCPHNAELELHTLTDHTRVDGRLFILPRLPVIQRS